MQTRKIIFLCLALAVGGCGKNESNTLQGTLPDWNRDRFERTENRALIYFVVYGQFSNDAAISGKKYRTAGLPPGLDARRLVRAQTGALPFTEAEFGRSLKDWELFQKISTAPECVVVSGEISDPENLNYLRDSIGLVSFHLDHGGFAVCDPQQLKLFTREQWQQKIFEPGATNRTGQVTILFSDEPDGRWYHTRGLRKFARPDISVRGVPVNYSAAALDLCNRFIQLEQRGGTIPEGQEIRLASLPSGLICHHAGSLDDPDFNNVHLEIVWPASPLQPASAH